MTIRFSEADLQLFAAASHDRNPLHLSALYGRRSQFGRQVVYGALGALAVMAKLQPPAGKRVAALTLEFSRAVFLDTDLELLIQPDGGALLMDGSTRMMKVSFQFADGEACSPALMAPVEGPRQSALLMGDAELAAGLERKGQYRPDAAAATALYERIGLDPSAWGEFPLSAILWASYLVGMEVPGERALFFRYSAAFEESVANGSMDWQVQVKGRNALNVLRSSFQLGVGGRRAASGQIEVLLRPLAVSSQFSFPRSEELRGKIALVTGASRGLGAALTRALVARGAHVLANFQQSLPDAERLRDELAGATGTVELVQGDASDRVWCMALRERYPKLDFLLLNACPTVLGMKVEPPSIDRLNAYVARAFELVSVPLAVLGGVVANRSVLVSSVYVETLPKEFPHYVAAKSAAEALLRVAARQYKAPGYLIVRPPKLLTDMTNTPFGSEDAIAPEGVACQVVDRMCAPGIPGEVEML